MGATVKGEDAAEERVQRRKALTVKELCDRYLVAADKRLILGKGDRPKRASSLYIDRGRMSRHIVPLIGKKRVQSLKPADINKLVEDVASGKTATIQKTGKKRGKSIVRGGCALSFPKIPSVWIRAMRQNQRIIRYDACDPPTARDVRRQPVQAAAPA